MLSKTGAAEIMARAMLEAYEEKLENDDLLPAEKERLMRLDIPSEAELRETCLDFIRKMESETDILNLSEDDLADVAGTLFDIAASDDRASFAAVSEDLGIPQKMAAVMEKGLDVFNFPEKGRKFLKKRKK